jgi:hypothetical protein
MWLWVQVVLPTILHRPTHLLRFDLFQVNGLLVKQRLMRVVPRQQFKDENQVLR